MGKQFVYLSRGWFYLAFLNSTLARALNKKEAKNIINSKLEIPFLPDYFVLFLFVVPGIFLQFHQNRPRFIHRDWRHKILRRTDAIAELAFVTLETIQFEKH